MQEIRPNFHMSDVLAVCVSGFALHSHAGVRLAMTELAVLSNDRTRVTGTPKE